MKVLVLSHMYPVLYNTAYGIFVHEQVKALIKQGCEVKVVSPVPCVPFPVNYINAKWGLYSRVPRRRTWEGVDVHYPRYLTFPKNFSQASSGLRMYLGIKKQVREIRRLFSFDIVHAHVPLPDGYAGMLLSREFKVPLVVTVHGGTLYFIAKERKAAYNAMQRPLKAASVVVTVSDKNRKILQTRGISEVQVVPNGIPLDLIQTLNNDRVNMIRENIPTKYFLLGVGNLVARKKFDVAIKAVAKLVSRGYDVTYIIIGEGTEKGRLLKLIKELRLEERVKILPRRERLLDVYEYMKACDIFLLPSVMEGFGVVFAEAMSLGKPIVGCKAGVVSDLVQHMKTGLLAEEDDVEGVSSLLEQLMVDSGLRRNIGQQAQKHVLDKFTWVRNAEQMLEVYQKAIRGYNRKCG